jgi:hypothetical protein
MLYMSYPVVAFFSPGLTLSAQGFFLDLVVRGPRR